MKKAIILFAITLSITSGLNAQKKDSTATPASEVLVNDSTGLIQFRDYQLFNQKIVSELPAKYADPIRAFFDQVFQYRAQEFMSRNKKADVKKK